MPVSPEDALTRRGQEGRDGLRWLLGPQRRFSRGLMPNLGMFRHTGALLRSPGGNVENVADQKPVIRWAALNVGSEVDRDLSRWSRQRSLYADAQIKTL